jgi:signal transduction histidine kinase
LGTAAALTLLFGNGVTHAQTGMQTGMKATAPQKMMSPKQEKKLKDCEQQAALRNIEMGKRAKFLMDCMTERK